MACRYYDDVIIAKLQKWIPEASKLRVLRPDESKRLFELVANDNKDQEFKLPLIALSRSDDIELLSATKNLKSFNGLQLSNIDGQLDRMNRTEYAKISDEKGIPGNTLVLNTIPIKLNYQLDIYTKTADEGDEYLRNFLFKLINNPQIKIEVPYNNTNLIHTANIRLENTVSNTSDVSERIFPGQFTRWTIQFEIQDAFLFSIPYKHNWKLYIDDNTVCLGDEYKSKLEIYDNKSYSEEALAEDTPIGLWWEQQK